MNKIIYVLLVIVTSMVLTVATADIKRSNGWEYCCDDGRVGGNSYMRSGFPFAREKTKNFTLPPQYQDEEPVSTGNVPLVLNFLVYSVVTSAVIYLILKIKKKSVSKK